MQANPNKPDMLPGRRHTLQPRLLLPHRPEVHSLSSHHEIAMKAESLCPRLYKTRSWKVGHPQLTYMHVHRMILLRDCLSRVQHQGHWLLEDFQPGGAESPRTGFPNSQNSSTLPHPFPNCSKYPVCSKQKQPCSIKWVTNRSPLVHLVPELLFASKAPDSCVNMWIVLHVQPPQKKKECKNHHPPQILRYGGQPAMCGKKSCLMILIQSELVRTALCKQRLEFVTMSLCFIAMTTIGNWFDPDWWPLAGQHVVVCFHLQHPLQGITIQYDALWPLTEQDCCKIMELMKYKEGRSEKERKDRKEAQTNSDPSKQNRNDKQII